MRYCRRTGAYLRPALYMLIRGRKRCSSPTPPPSCSFRLPQSRTKACAGAARSGSPADATIMLLDLLKHFSATTAASRCSCGAQRHIGSQDGVDIVRDDFSDEAASALFLRVHSSAEGSVRLRLAGNHLLKRCAIGGLDVPADDAEPGGLLGAAPADVPDPGCLRTHFARNLPRRWRTWRSAAERHRQRSAPARPGAGLCRLWSLQSANPGTDEGHSVDELMTTTSLESQPYFIYASHSATRCAADFYTYLVHGRCTAPAGHGPEEAEDLRRARRTRPAHGSQRAGPKHGQARSPAAAPPDRAGSPLPPGRRRRLRHGEWTNQYESHTG